MRLKKYLLGCLAVVVSQAGLAQEPSVNEVTQEKPLINLTAKNTAFTIKLKSNPTTGYSWFLRDYNSALLEPIKHKFEAPTEKKLMGAPGYEVWTFKAKPAAFTVPQQTTIRFIYARPWESTDSPTQAIFKITTTSGK